MELRTIFVAGSSPRMRGALGFIVADYLSGGIIPAYAGSTGKLKLGVGIIWDHPRVCGEHPLAWRVSLI